MKKDCAPEFFIIDVKYEKYRKSRVDVFWPYCTCIGPDPWTQHNNAMEI